MPFDQRNRKVTNHDVKAVEYFIKDALKKGLSIQRVHPFWIDFSRY
jgi:adenylosuccinate lyase